MNGGIVFVLFLAVGFFAFVLYMANLSKQARLDDERGNQLSPNEQREFEDEYKRTEEVERKQKLRHSA